MILIRCETGDDVQVEAETLLGANLSRLNLHRALLDGEVLRGADLSDTELRSAWLEGTNFERAKLTRASLAASNASRANFSGANLREAMMRSGIYASANFSGADLRDAKVGGAVFTSAIFDGADLRCEGLERAKLEGARADPATRWPEGFKLEDHGVLMKGRDMPNGEAIREAVERAARAHAQAQDWKVEQIIVGQVTVLPTKQRVALVRIILQGGAQRCFEYRCDASGVGGLWPVESP